MEQLVVFSVLLGLGYFFGISNEKKHYKSIRTREKKYRNTVAVSFKSPPISNDLIQDQKLVMGSTVVSIDYFKLMYAGIQSLFGGRLRSYESLVDRARREALLRMKKDAKGYSMILNVKVETSSISKGTQNKGVGSVEVLAYGTAIKVNEV
ncbi:YbjQ family protein [Halobacteriovorax sp. HLS]|uniref:YbjQ family protein n=1 Tax=Halobacteriovorax sp. HLS TaxID=2234000 RepID=UPI000FD79E52|nr:heavy metal-binding domain-containing protein [Halobacteriovorax sp. HLS]